MAQRQLFSAFIALLVTLAPAVHAQQVAPSIPEGACYEDYSGPRLYLTLNALKSREGQFRIELYRDQPELFLEGEGRVYKYFAPVPPEGEALCITAPGPGQYGLLVIHDINANSKPDIFTDGFGLSTNPKLKLRRPKFEEAAFTLDSEEMSLSIDLQYVTGDSSKKRRRRR